MVNLPSPKSYLKFQFEVLIIYIHLKSLSLRTLTLEEIVNTGFVIAFWKHQVKKEQKELKIENICFVFICGGGCCGACKILGPQPGIEPMPLES